MAPFWFSRAWQILFDKAKVFGSKEAPRSLPEPIVNNVCCLHKIPNLSLDAKRIPKEVH
jgi:hypothetical protein